MVVDPSPVAVTQTSDFAPVSREEFLDIQATIDCGFTLKRVRDMIRTYSQEWEGSLFQIISQDHYPAEVSLFHF